MSENPAEKATCAACHEPIVDRWFEINRTIVCEACRDSILEQLRGGRGFGRFARAALYGLAAATLGTALYATFLRYSTVDLSLIAIAVGYLVGRMVRKGSGGLGGLAYQGLAVALTYASLGMTYFATVLLELRRAGQLDGPIGVTPGLLLVLLDQAFRMPVLRMQASPIRVFFVGFALWQAWRLNRRRPLVVTGPHPVGPVDAPKG